MITAEAQVDNNYRFQLIHLGDSYKKSWSAVAYGDPLPRRGVTAYGTSQWDALANVAIAAATYVYALDKRTRLAGASANVKVTQETPKKRKKGR